MAAMRSALISFCRRSCGNSGSAGFASMAGRGVDIRQAIISTAPRALFLPSFRPTAIRNLEGLRCFSVEKECADQTTFLMKHKAESIPRMWWQRSSDCVKNFIITHPVLAGIGCVASLGYVAFLPMLHSRKTSSSTKVFRPIHYSSNTSTGRRRRRRRFWYPHPSYWMNRRSKRV